MKNDSNLSDQLRDIGGQMPDARLDEIEHLWETEGWAHDRDIDDVIRALRAERLKSKQQPQPMELTKDVFRERELIRLAKEQPVEVGSKSWHNWLSRVGVVLDYYERKFYALEKELETAKSAYSDLLVNSGKEIRELTCAYEELEIQASRDNEHAQKTIKALENKLDAMCGPGSAFTARRAQERQQQDDK